MLSLVKELDPRLEHTPPGSPSKRRIGGGGGGVGDQNEFLNLSSPCNIHSSSQKAHSPSFPVPPVFAYVIDGLHNVIESKLAHGIIATVMSDSATLISEGKRNKQTQLISELDFDGYLASPHFKGEKNKVLIKKQ